MTWIVILLLAAGFALVYPAQMPYADTVGQYVDQALFAFAQFTGHTVSLQDRLLWATVMAILAFIILMGMASDSKKLRLRNARLSKWVDEEVGLRKQKADEAEEAKLALAELHELYNSLPETTDQLKRIANQLAPAAEIAGMAEHVPAMSVPSGNEDPVSRMERVAVEMKRQVEAVAAHVEDEAARARVQAVNEKLDSSLRQLSSVSERRQQLGEQLAMAERRRSDIESALRELGDIRELEQRLSKLNQFAGETQAKLDGVDMSLEPLQRLAGRLAQLERKSASLVEGDGNAAEQLRELGRLVDKVSRRMDIVNPPQAQGQQRKQPSISERINQVAASVAELEGSVDNLDPDELRMRLGSLAQRVSALWSQLSPGTVVPALKSVPHHAEPNAAA